MPFPGPICREPLDKVTCTPAWRLHDSIATPVARARQPTPTHGGSFRKNRASALTASAPTACTHLPQPATPAHGAMYAPRQCQSCTTGIAAATLIAPITRARIICPVYHMTTGNHRRGDAGLLRPHFGPVPSGRQKTPDRVRQPHRRGRLQKDHGAGLPGVPSRSRRRLFEQRRAPVR